MPIIDLNGLRGGAKLLFLAGLVSTSLAPTPARAQAPTAAVLLAVGGDLDAPAATHEEARRAAEELLGQEDFEVFDEARLRSSLDEAGQACLSGEGCAAAVRATLGTDLLVGIVIRAEAGEATVPARVELTVVDEAARYSGAAEVSDGIGAAVQAALGEALREQLRGPGPFIRVHGTPEAACELDAAAVGTLPLTVHAEVGEHTVRVRLDGFRTETVQVTIGSDSPRTTEVEIVLHPEESMAEPDLLANLLLGGGLGAAGLALMVSPIATLVGQGQCTDSLADGRCAAGVRFGELSGALLGVGAALLAAGVVIAILQPITVSVSASPDAARLELQGQF